MHLTNIDEPSLRPTKILDEADRLMEHTRALYEKHEQIMNPIDRTVAEDKMTWANDFRHGIEDKSWMDQAEQAKLYFNQAQEALETVKVVFTIPYLRRGAYYKLSLVRPEMCRQSNRNTVPE
ncbi:hypothetical protein EDB89DRAFT_1910730 [Lactarius sanguifluus]|nr:hypothetical protein EDB89DRAFT_1910730 [Lactarius sanguifluus]